jgi:hypothetical protein
MPSRPSAVPPSAPDPGAVRPSRRTLGALLAAAALLPTPALAAPGVVTFPSGGVLNWVAVSDTTPCAGAPLIVYVGASHPTTPAAPVEVQVDGFPGTPQIVQYLAPGSQKIRVYALSRGLTDQRELPITVASCPGQTSTLRMLYNQNPFHKDRVDFHAELKGRARGRAYLWYFGDGTTATTTVPFVSHDYAPKVAPADKYTYFTAFVMETGSQLVSGKNIAIGSSFHRSRMMGFVQADVRPTVTKTDQGFVVGLDIRNSHKTSIRLNRYFKQYLPCEVDRESARFEDVPAELVFGTGVTITRPPGVLAPGTVVVGAGQTARSRLVLPLDRIPPETCVIGFNLMGVTTDRQKVYGNFYLPVRRNPKFTKAVADVPTLKLLQELVDANLLPATGLVTGEDLYLLEQRGLIARTAGGWRRIP